MAKKADSFFEIRTQSVITDRPLEYDLHLMVGGKPICFRKRGDILTGDRVRQLLEHGGEQLLVLEEQRTAYLNSIKSIVADPQTKTDQKSRFIKESAFVHVHDLFTKQDISPVVSEAKILVEEMVNFVSSDVEAVSSLMRLSSHDYYTYNHCVDVAVYAIALAKRIFGEDKNQLMLAGLGGLLHDIGKRKVDSKVINKTTKLTKEEWEDIQRHPTYGKEYLESVPIIPIETKLVVFEHHENYDGTGYPQGIAGETISSLARIVSIADVFDALTTNRSYHKAVSPVEALNTMYSMQPGKFDPNVFKLFNKNFDQKAKLALEKDFDPCQVSGIKLKIAK